ncbi:MAG: phosphatase PAP2 family protein [Dehalococcoidia bacterium]|nr:phosphatase PAP2 family protein [Dehalococcoidia bacterium]
MNSGKRLLLILRKNPRPLWLDILFEITILFAVYMIYAFSRGSLDEKASIAFQHARDIMDLEKHMGIFVEKDIQSFFLESSFRTDIANLLYTVCYYPALVFFAIWAYWRHRAKYKFIRTVFIVSAALAFVVFALYPLAPPRFFDGTHGAENLNFVDTIHTNWSVNEDSTKRFYNSFAAMPSLHQGWTIMIGIGMMWMTKRWWGRLLGIILPVAMFFGITSTANHFVLDAVGGAIVIGLSFGISALIWKYKDKFHLRRSQAPSQVIAVDSPKEE